MGINFLILSIFLVSCGREVHLKPNKLESTQQITEADINKYQKSATINTANQTIIANGQSYKISAFSSHSALEFIKALPANSQIPILYIGGINGNEIVLENVQRR